MVRSRIQVAAMAVAGVAMAAVVLSGCSSSAGASASKGSGQVTLASDNPQWQAGFVEMGKITSKTTGYTIKSYALPDTVSYTQAVLQALPTPKTPDIVKWWSGKMVEAVAASGQVADLTKVWDAAVKAGDLNDALRPYYSYKGKVYAIPLGVSDSVHYYSKAAFQKAGITNVPQTFDEFQADLGKLKNAGYTPLCLPAGDAWPVIMPYQTIAGAIDPEWYQNLTQNKAKWNDPTGVKVLQTISDWIKKGYTTSTDVKGADCAGLMKSGKVALTNFGTWNNGAMITAGMTSKDYGAFIAPSQSGPGSKNYFIEASSLMVAQNSPNRKAAEDTVLAWLKEDAQKEWLKTTLDLPVNPKVTTDDPVLKQVMAQVSTEKPSPLNRYYEAFPPKLVQSTIATLQAFMVTGDNPQGVADTLQKQADTEWAAWDKDPSIG